MTEYITIGTILEQVKKTHPTIWRELLALITLGLAKGTLKPLSLLEVTNMQAKINGWAPIPSWLYNEVGNEELLSEYLKKAGADPRGSEDYIYLYSDEFGEWYADISELTDICYNPEMNNLDEYIGAIVRGTY